MFWNNNVIREAAAMGLKDWLKRLERDAGQDRVLIYQQDGTIKAFDRMHVMAQLYVAGVHEALGEPPPTSDVMAALENATPESRAAVEEMATGGRFLDDPGPQGNHEEVEDLSEQARQNPGDMP